jgi:hypothetical protein
MPPFAEAALVQRHVGEGLFLFGFGQVGHVGIAVTRTMWRRILALMSWPRMWPMPIMPASARHACVQLVERRPS